MFNVLQNQVDLEWPLYRQSTQGKIWITIFIYNQLLSQYCFHHRNYARYCDNNQLKLWNTDIKYKSNFTIVTMSHIQGFVCYWLPNGSLKFSKKLYYTCCQRFNGRPPPADWLHLQSGKGIKTQYFEVCVIKI